MIDLKNIEGIYFVGIGGIGMSALALYFAKGGFKIAGYDRLESGLTRSLTETGCAISYTDTVESIPELFRNTSEVERVIVVFTPAIPSENNIMWWWAVPDLNR